MFVESSSHAVCMLFTAALVALLLHVVAAVYLGVVRSASKSTISDEGESRMAPACLACGAALAQQHSCKTNTASSPELAPRNVQTTSSNPRGRAYLNFTTTAPSRSSKRRGAVPMFEPPMSKTQHLEVASDSPSPARPPPGSGRSRSAVREGHRRRGSASPHIV